MMTGLVRHLLETGIITATACVILSVLQWTLTSPWWRDPVGRTVVVKDFGLLVLLIPNMLSIFWRHSIPFMVIAWTDVASLFIVAAALAWRCVVWYRINTPWPLPHKDGSPRVHVSLRARADKDS